MDFQPTMWEPRGLREPRGLPFEDISLMQARLPARVQGAHLNQGSRGHRGASNLLVMPVLVEYI